MFGGLPFSSLKENWNFISKLSVSSSQSKIVSVYASVSTMTLAPLLLVTLALAVVREAASLPSFSGTFRHYHYHSLSLGTFKKLYHNKPVKMKQNCMVASLPSHIKVNITHESM